MELTAWANKQKGWD